jgi:hypothetical protein
VKIHDFGLWFSCDYETRWSKTIPEDGTFDIYYDGICIGWFTTDCCLGCFLHKQYVIRLKRDYPPKEPNSQVLVYGFTQFLIGGLLTLEDFDIELCP